MDDIARPRRERGVDLEGHTEQNVGDWQLGPSGSAGYSRRLLHGVAELPEQGHEVVALVDLGRVVSRPVLGVGDALGLGSLDGAARVFFPLYQVLDAVDVLAGQLPQLEVGARAEGGRRPG